MKTNRGGHFRRRQRRCFGLFWRSAKFLENKTSVVYMAASNASLDPLQALSAALAVPADSLEQASLLASLRDSLEKQPNRIPILCTALITTISGAGDSLLKRWVLDLLHFGLACSSLPLETRTQRS